MPTPTREEVQAVLQRLDALEAELRALRRQVEAWSETTEAEEPPPATPEAAVPETAPTAPQQPFAFDPQAWLARLGVLLIFLGVGFFFVYAVQQGWLMPVVRILLGLAAGFILLALGWIRAPRHPSTAAVLAGGGLALWYLSWFAAHALYDLVPFAVAFGAATLTTALAYGLAWLRFHPAIAALGVIGGLLTPVVLSSQGGSFLALNAYVLLVLAGGAGVYVRSGSLTVLLAMWSAGWGLYAWQVDTVGAFPAAVITQRLIVQVALTAFVLQLWWLPLWRLARTPARWLAQLGAIVGATFAPILWSVHTFILWDMPDRPAGSVLLGVALTCALLAWGLRNDANRPHAATAHGATALLTSIPAWPLLLNGASYLETVLTIAYTLQAAALHIVAWRRRSTTAALGAHLMTLITGIIVWVRFFETTLPPFGAEVWASLLFIAMLIAAAQWRGRTEMRRAYEIAAHIFALGWLAREAALLEWGMGGVSFLWALVGVIEYVTALARGHRWLYRYGFALLILVGLKLLILDTQTVALLWRAVLFMVLGGVYVALGVLGQRWLVRETPEPDLQKS